MVFLYIGISVLALLILYFIITFIIYLICFSNVFKMKNVINEKSEYYPYLSEIQKYGKLFNDLEKESVEVKSKDNLILRGYFIKNKYENKVVILFHGYKSKGSLSLMYDFYNLGYSLLVIDQRAHGRSDGKYIGMGILERYDALKWIDFVVDKCGKDTSILLYGVSMGGATVMMASELIKQKQVKGIIADCGFSSCYNQVRSCISKIPEHPLIDTVNMYSKIFGKYNMKIVTSEKSLSNSEIPLLIIHGRKDSFVPCLNLDLCYQASKSKIKDFLYVDNAIHATSCIDGSQDYDRKIKEFLKNINY